MNQVQVDSDFFDHSQKQVAILHTTSTYNNVWKPLEKVAAT